MKRLTITNIDDKLYDDFQAICRELNIKKSPVLKLLINYFIKKYKKGEIKL